MSLSIYDNGMYDELWALSHELTPWFDIDKVKPYSVYVWTKDTEDPCCVHGENVFDIFYDRLQFYQCMNQWEMPNEAMPVIKKIQDKLKEIVEFYEWYVFQYTEVDSISQGVNELDGVVFIEGSDEDN